MSRRRGAERLRRGGDPAAARTSRRWWRWLLVVAAVAAVATAAVLGWFVWWGSTPAPPRSAAFEALATGDGVTVTRTPSGWAFGPASGAAATTGLVLYPGGRVDPRAYAPLARAIASHGFAVVIVRMPLSLAFLDAAAAERARTEVPGITTWAIGGHSLGGVAASSYVAQHPRRMAGLVLLSSYPAEGTDLSAAQGPQGPLQALSVRGSEDRLTTAAKVEASKPRLPPETVYLVIEGGNHAQMGEYGPQSGDGAATIPAARQTRETADAVSLFLGKL
jgi:predicted alpha/beta-hydrolase family hydrolase